MTLGKRKFEHTSRRNTVNRYIKVCGIFKWMTIFSVYFPRIRYRNRSFRSFRFAYTFQPERFQTHCYYAKCSKVRHLDVILCHRNQGRCEDVTAIYIMYWDWRKAIPLIQIMWDCSFSKPSLKSEYRTIYSSCAAIYRTGLNMNIKPWSIKGHCLLQI